MLAGTGGEYDSSSDAYGLHLLRIRVVEPGITARNRVPPRNINVHAPVRPLVQCPRSTRREPGRDTTHYDWDAGQRDVDEYDELDCLAIRASANLNSRVSMSVLKLRGVGRWYRRRRYLHYC